MTGDALFEQYRGIMYDPLSVMDMPETTLGHWMAAWAISSFPNPKTKEFWAHITAFARTGDGHELKAAAAKSGYWLSDPEGYPWLDDKFGDALWGLDPRCKDSPPPGEVFAKSFLSESSLMDAQLKQLAMEVTDRPELKTKLLGAAAAVRGTTLGPSGCQRLIDTVAEAAPFADREQALLLILSATAYEARSRMFQKEHNAPER